jgi:hypothetical protein
VGKIAGYLCVLESICGSWLRNVVSFLLQTTYTTGSGRMSTTYSGKAVNDFITVPVELGCVHLLINFTEVAFWKAVSATELLSEIVQSLIYVNRLASISSSTLWVRIFMDAHAHEHIHS